MFSHYDICVVWYLLAVLVITNAFETVCLLHYFVTVPRGSCVIMGQGADITSVIPSMLCVTNITYRSYKGLSY